MAKSQVNNLMIFVYPLKTSGGTKVFDRLYDQIVLNGLCCEKFIPKDFSGHFFGYLSLVWFIIKRLFSKPTGIKHVYVVTDPLQCVIIACFPVIYIRYVQADDLNLFNKRKGGWIIKILQRFASFRDRNVLFASDFCKASYLHSCFGKRHKCTLKVSPTVDPVFARRTVRKSGNNVFSICYMPRKAVSKGLCEFCLWMNEIYQDAPSWFPKSIVFVSNEVTEAELVQLCDFKFKYVNPKCQDEIASILSMSKVFVFNSESEGFGLPPLEALLSNCIVISSRCGGITEFLNGDNSFLFDSHNFEQFRHSLQIALTDGIESNTARHELGEYEKYFSIRKDTVESIMGMMEK